MAASSPDRVGTWAWGMACVYAASGVAAMWLLSPRVPYADVWRHQARLLSQRVPDNVIAADNGHAELLPNLVRVLDLRVAAGDQSLVTAAGILLALATLVAAWGIVRTVAAPARRAAAMLCVAFGLFWLGSARTLMHGSEAVHAYAVTLFLFAGLCLLAREPRRGRVRSDILAAAGATGCALAAAFSFGSGIACFAGFGAVLLLRRSAAGLAILASGSLAVFALVRAAGGAGLAPAFDPLPQGDLLLRWLGAPLAYAAWPLLDPVAAGQWPGLRLVLVPLAHVAEAVFGPLAAAPRWPHAALGLAGLAWLVALAWRGWAQPRVASTATLAGIGIASFALATGLLVVAMRLDYFAAQPGEILAPRYIVWSALFWTGLMLSTAAQLRSGRHAALLAVVAAVLLLPSHVQRGVHGAALKSAADQAAVAAAVGVIEPGSRFGESVASELALALPHLREAGVAVHAWPETRALGRRVADHAAGASPATAVEVAVVQNLIGQPGRRVRFASGALACERLLLADADGVIRGLAHREGEGAWIGWMQGTPGGTPRVLGCLAPGAAAAARPGSPGGFAQRAGASAAFGALPNPPSASAAR